MRKKSLRLSKRARKRPRKKPRTKKTDSAISATKDHAKVAVA
jgi:hypothetical protein